MNVAIWSSIRYVRIYYLDVSVERRRDRGNQGEREGAGNKKGEGEIETNQYFHAFAPYNELLGACSSGLFCLVAEDGFEGGYGGVEEGV